jgi:carbon storage regulator
MLILSRKSGQSIIIGKDIKITVTNVTNNSVKIGIDAPKSVAVHRTELIESGGSSKEK